jgi:hypothetical protein
MDDLRALSLTPPWPWAILHCGKRIENREAWLVPAYTACCEHRGMIALHASRLPTGVDSYWKRAQKTPSCTPRESQAFAIDDFETTVDGIMSAARAAGISLSRPTLQRLCEQTGHIVGVASIIGMVTSDPSYRSEKRWRAHINADPAGRNGVRELTEDERRWWFGGFALVLDEVRDLKRPVPCKGALGLWPVPKDVLAQVRAQL